MAVPCTIIIIQLYTALLFYTGYKKLPRIKYNAYNRTLLFKENQMLRKLINWIYKTNQSEDPEITIATELFNRQYEV
jgi:hypothetical protein